MATGIELRARQEAQSESRLWDLMKDRNWLLRTSLETDLQKAATRMVDDGRLVKRYIRGHVAYLLPGGVK